MYYSNYNGDINFKLFLRLFLIKGLEVYICKIMKYRIRNTYGHAKSKILIFVVIVLLLRVPICLCTNLLDTYFYGLCAIKNK